MNKTRFLSVLFMVVALVVTMSVVPGCKTTTTGETTAAETTAAETTAAETTAAETAAPEEPVEIVLWNGNWHETDSTAKIIKEFETQNPGIKVRMEAFPWDGMEDKYLISLKNDAGPDVLDAVMEWAMPYATMGKLAPLDDFIVADKMDMSDFYEGALKGAQANGKTIALPGGGDVFALSYNKKIIRDAGLDPDTPPKTYADLLEYAKATTKGDVFGFGLVGGGAPASVVFQLTEFVYANGGSILNNDNTKCTLNEPAAIEAIQLYHDFFRKYHVTPKSTMENDGIANRELFASGKVAMLMTGIYDLDPIMSANPNIELGTCLLPKMTEHKNLYSGWNMVLTNTSKNKEASWKLIKFLTSREIQPIYFAGFTSTRKSNATDKAYSNPLYKAFLEGLDYAVSYPLIPQMGQIKQIVFDNLQYAMNDQKTVEEAMNQATIEIDKLLQQ